MLFWEVVIQNSTCPEVMAAQDAELQCSTGRRQHEGDCEGCGLPRLPLLVLDGGLLPWPPQQQLGA